MEKRIRIARIDELKDGEIAPFLVDGQDIAVARAGDRVFAVEDRCSHADCPLSEGVLEDIVVICPCHASGFDLSNGQPLNPPAVEAIRCFRVTVEDGDVFIRF